MSFFLEFGSPQLNGNPVEVTIRHYGGKIHLFIGALEYEASEFLAFARGALLSTTHEADHPFTAFRTALETSRFSAGYPCNYQDKSWGLGVVIIPGERWIEKSSRLYDRNLGQFHTAIISPTDLCIMVDRCLVGANLYGHDDPRIIFAREFNPNLSEEALDLASQKFRQAID